MAADSGVRTRRVAEADLAALVPLLRGYMREAYDAEWNGSVDTLRRDALGQRCTVQVALVGGSVVGMLAWIPSYDLHHCVPGAEALDLYVVPASRGRGIALLLGCAAAAEVSRDGGLYLKGSVVGSGSARRLYSRFAICDAAGCIVSGRAFRRLAELAGRPIREVVRSLPESAWNLEG